MDESKKVLDADLYEALLGTAQVMYWVAKKAYDRMQQEGVDVGWTKVEFDKYMADWENGGAAVNFARTNGRRLFRLLGADVVRVGINIQSEADLLRFIRNIEAHLQAAEAAPKL